MKPGTPKRPSRSYVIVNPDLIRVASKSMRILGYFVIRQGNEKPIPHNKERGRCDVPLFIVEEKNEQPTGH